MVVWGPRKGFFPVEGPNYPLCSGGDAICGVFLFLLDKNSTGSRGNLFRNRTAWIVNWFYGGFQSLVRCCLVPKFTNAEELERSRGREAESQNHRITESKNHEITESQNHRTTESQNHKTAEPQNHRITKSQLQMTIRYMCEGRESQDHRILDSRN